MKARAAPPLADGAGREKLRVGDDVAQRGLARRVGGSASGLRLTEPTTWPAPGFGERPVLSRGFRVCAGSLATSGVTISFVAEGARDPAARPDRPRAGRASASGRTMRRSSRAGRRSGSCRTECEWPLTTTWDVGRSALSTMLRDRAAEVRAAVRVGGVAVAGPLLAALVDQQHDRVDALPREPAPHARWRSPPRRET